MWTGSHVDASSQEPQEALPRHATRRLARLGSSEDPPREERGVERMRTPRRAGHFPPLPTAPTPPCTPVPGNKARGRATVVPRSGSGTRGLRHRSRAPHRAFSVGPELSGCRPLPPPADEPLGPASGPGSPYDGRGKPAQPSTGAARPAAPQAAGPHGRPRRIRLAPSPTRRSPARRHRL